AEVPPRGLHPGVAAEADRGAEGEGRILAEIVVARRVTELDRAGLYRVEHLQTRDDLARGKGADLELAVGDLADALCDQLRAAEQRVEALAPAGRHAPRDGRLRLCDRRRRDRRGTRGRTQPGRLDESASFHLHPPQ